MEVIEFTRGSAELEIIKTLAECAELCKDSEEGSGIAVIYFHPNGEPELIGLCGVMVNELISGCFRIATQQARMHDDEI